MKHFGFTYAFVKIFVNVGLAIRSTNWKKKNGLSSLLTI